MFMSKTRVDLQEGQCVCVDVNLRGRHEEDLHRQERVCVCVYVKDTSRSTETGSVCVCL